MQWGVELAKPFHYSPIGLILLLIFLGFIVLYIVYRINNNKQEPIKVVVKVIDRNKIRMEYLAKLDTLDRKYKGKKITTRKAYNELSVLIREFIFKLTRVNLLKYSLSDFKKLNNPVLLELINEYYEPEFSYEGEGNLEVSIQKTRKVISEWK